jgi:hypothetical protein
MDYNFIINRKSNSLFITFNILKLNNSLIAFLLENESKNLNSSVLLLKGPFDEEYFDIQYFFKIRDIIKMSKATSIILIANSYAFFYILYMLQNTSLSDIIKDNIYVINPEIPKSNNLLTYPVISKSNIKILHNTKNDFSKFIVNISVFKSNKNIFDLFNIFMENSFSNELIENKLNELILFENKLNTIKKNVVIINKPKSKTKTKTKIKNKAKTKNKVRTKNKAKTKAKTKSKTKIKSKPKLKLNKKNKIKIIKKVKF